MGMELKSDSRELTKHLVLLGVVIAVVALFYARISGAWFCGYDDFSEAHRAAFDDSANPVRILTTTHNMPFMYRPVTSALQYVTWTVFHHSALAFRLRNLGMHLVSVAMLYGIVWSIAGSRPVAAGAALLFGLEPMSNETIVVAIWTNATAYALVLCCFFLFLRSLEALRRSSRWKPLLLASLACAFLAIFTYEPTIAVFALMAGYLFVWKARSLPITRGFLTFLFAGIAVELAVFFIARHVVITQGAPMNSIGAMLRNAIMYAVALLLPMDFVLANALFGTPLPSQLHVSKGALILPALFALALLLAAAIAVRQTEVRTRLASLDRPALAFFAAAIPIGVLPLLLFRDHASEHDLYPSAAFYTALLCMLVWQIARSRAVYAAIVLLFTFSFAGATWVRNERVATCATIAQRIITQLPVAHWREGAWHIRLATPPGKRLGEPYGAYNDYGLHSLETEKGLTPGAKDAVQIAAENRHITVDVVNERTILRDCNEPYTCFWVSPSGVVRDAVPVKRGVYAHR